MTEAQHPAGTVLPVQNETFSYDAVSNRLADAQIGGYTYDGANELTSNSSFTYTYDADGNQTSKTDLSSNVTTYSFDSRNELTGVALPGGTNWTYQYDALMRRVAKSSGTAASQGIQYVYDGPNILAMLDNSNNLIDVFTNSLSIDEPLLMHTAGGSDYVYSRDAMSVRTITDSSGNIVETYKYLAYGQPLIEKSSESIIGTSAIGNTFMFAGSVLDGETGTYSEVRRYYDPTAGRFQSADPLGIAGGIDQYAYVGNNPTRFVDPLGAKSSDTDAGPNSSGTTGSQNSPQNQQGTNSGPHSTAYNACYKKCATPAGTGCLIVGGLATVACDLAIEGGDPELGALAGAGVAAICIGLVDIKCTNQAQLCDMQNSSPAQPAQPAQPQPAPAGGQ